MTTQTLALSDAEQIAIKIAMEEILENYARHMGLQALKEAPESSQAGQCFRVYARVENLRLGCHEGYDLSGRKAWMLEKLARRLGRLA